MAVGRIAHSVRLGAMPAGLGRVRTVTRLGDLAEPAQLAELARRDVARVRSAHPVPPSLLPAPPVLEASARSKRSILSR